MEPRKRPTKFIKQPKTRHTEPVPHRSLSGCKTTSYTFVVVTFVSVLLISGAAFLMWLHMNEQSPRPKLVLTDPDEERPPSPSLLYKYYKGAVSSDGVPCSKIGRDVLYENGTAVDAAVATLLCNGIVNMEAMGIGGGFIMTIYVRSERKSYSVIARESAPMSAHQEMFSHIHGDSLYEPSRTAGLAVGVPGELKGYWEIWKRFGRLPWKRLVAPSVALCRRGYELSKPQRDALDFRPDTPKIDHNLRRWFVDPETGKFRKWGSMIIPWRLCEAYEHISEKGGLSMHGGQLTKIFVQDVNEVGGALSMEDMIKYKVDWRKPLTIRLGQDILYTAPPPGSGALLCHILLILNGYNFTMEDFSTVPKTVSSIHKVVESFKYAFANRGLLGDLNFVNITSILNNLTSKHFAADIRSKIMEDTTFNDPEHYGGVDSRIDDHGTNHVSILSPVGDAVSATSTINLYFGAGFTSRRTGILLNSVMDDFSIPNITNYFEFPPSSYNCIQPGKKPMSSAAPSIVVDKHGNVKLVIGASGGSRIITAVAWVIFRFIWLGQDIKAAIDASRIHHQLTPMTLTYEYGLLNQVVDGLKAMGHSTERYTVRGSVVSAVAKRKGIIYANADFRKFGGVEGLN